MARTACGRRHAATWRGHLGRSAHARRMQPGLGTIHSHPMGSRARMPGPHGTHGLRPEARSQCERTYMKSTGESPSHPETSNGKAAGGNCVVVRRGGEQPEADLRSQTRVNPIRFTTAASLLASGEACRTSGNRFLPHPSFTGEKRAVVDGWGENAGKVSCGRVESCPGRNPRERSRAAVRVAIVVMKRGNARGAKGGRKVERQRP